MKIVTITSLIGLGLSASAASLAKRIDHPTQPKSEAALIAPVAAGATPRDPRVSIWVETNQTKTANEVEIFVSGPFIDPKNVTTGDLRDITVAVLEVSPLVHASAAVAAANSTVQVWIEGPSNTTNATAVDIFVSGPFNASSVTSGDLIEIATGILELSKKADAGAAPRPGPYVPGSSQFMLGGAGQGSAKPWRGINV